MIFLGPAGSAGLGNEEGLKKAASMGLKCYEVEFTHGVQMKNDLAKKLGKLASELGIKLSIHAPYYINLASKEKPKIFASKKRILDSCERGHYLGAKKVVFHAGFFQGQDVESVYEMIKEALVDMQGTIKKRGWSVELAPEVTGKPSQFGSIEELMRLRKEIGISYCVDFAHLYARQQGKIDYSKVLKMIPDKEFHAHFSGINYGPKGERNHIAVDIDQFKKLARAINKAKKEVSLINESPYIFEDLERMLKALS
ncbi:MAG: TIM barrel protein [archaeon]